MDEDAISLYFGLKKGERADLEVVAQAALLWVEVVRAAAVAIDPNAKIRIEIVDASESSIRLNTILKWIEDQLKLVDEGSSDYPRLRALAAALALFLIVDGPSAYEYWFGDPPVLELSEEDRRRIDELLERTKKSPDISQPRRKFFKTLERDPSILNVGLSKGRDSPPIVTIPSKEFAERGGLWARLEDDTERTTYSVIDVILISPVLIGLPRSWKFQPVEGLPEFSAVMRDQQFLDALEERHVRERLRTGIRMTVRLQIKERKVGEGWVAKKGGRSVVEVISPRPI